MPSGGVRRLWGHRVTPAGPARLPRRCVTSQPGSSAQTDHPHGADGGHELHRPRLREGRRAAGQRPHVQHVDDPQVEEHRDQAVEDADHGQPDQVLADRGPEDQELGDEADGRRDPGQREHGHREGEATGTGAPSPARPGRRSGAARPRSRRTPRPPRRRRRSSTCRPPGRPARRRAPSAPNGDDADQRVAHVGDAGVGEHALEVALDDGHEVAERLRGDGDDREQQRPSAASGPGGQVDAASRRQDHQRGALGHHREEGGDRRRRALVDVGRPGVEREQGQLEAEAGRRTGPGRPAPACCRPGRWATATAAMPCSEKVPVAPYSRAMPKSSTAGGEGADHEVLEARPRGDDEAVAVEGVEDVEADRQQLEAEERRRAGGRPWP